ncbi:ABC transporter permease subunit [Mycoplasmopsis mucosicanis]|uniref:ABC transporter permease subunit n=1 Tax=Mycoplasmopsis mucosicanis TaxID=458208 RepID=A0A507SV23_9BACT|nr:ABC transporter permease subunit [Mycoplasmopsis mucosicanis]TQC54075.1 ABC transporter permease subunit [Mycoplasmopsis mucosicanis]
MRNEQKNTEKSVVLEKKWWSFRYKNYSKNTHTNWKIKPIFRHILLFLIIILIAYLFYEQSSKIQTKNFGIFLKRIANIFQFNSNSTRITGKGTGEYTNLWSDSLIALWTTIKVGVVGTFTGFILALISTYVSFDKATNKYSSFIFKCLLLLFRSMPELVLIGLVTKTFQGEFSLLIVYALFTWLWLHRYYLDMLESIDLKAYWTSINQGNSKTVAFFKEVWPRAKHRINALFIFSFESNMRWASILGALSLPGIGLWIRYGSTSTNFFTELGIPLSILMVFILLLEIINIVLKRYLFEAKTKKIIINKDNKSTQMLKLSNHIQWRRIIYGIIVAFFLITTIAYFINVNKWLFDLSSTKQFLKAFIKPDFSKFSFSSLTPSINPILMIWESLKFSIVALSICIVLTILSIRVQNSKINKLWFAFLMRCINIFIRLIPTVVYFYTLDILFASPLFLVILIIGVHEMSSKSKQLTEAIDNLDEEIIANMRLQGYTNNQIFFKFILPSIKKDFVSLSLFYFELIFRASITYSIFVNGSKNSLSIGDGIWQNLIEKGSSYQPNIAMAYAWIGTFSILTINIFSSIIKKKIYRF